MKRSRERHADRRRLRRAITDQHRRWINDAIQRALAEMLADPKPVPYIGDLSAEEQRASAERWGRFWLGIRPPGKLIVHPVTEEDRAQRRVRTTYVEPIETITVTLNVGCSESVNGLGACPAEISMWIEDNTGPACLTCDDDDDVCRALGKCDGTS